MRNTVTVEEDQDQCVTRMPKHCLKWECKKAKLGTLFGFRVCPVCGASYGRSRK